MTDMLVLVTSRNAATMARNTHSSKLLELAQTRVRLVRLRRENTRVLAQLRRRIDESRATEVVSPSTKLRLAS